MEPGGSKQDGGVVNMTRAMEALSPWLNNPRKTIIQVESLVVAAAALVLLQLILGSCRRRWHKSFIKYGLQVCNGIMLPLIVYTLGTMQSSPVKNSSYPIWAAFLIIASAGTTAVRQPDFYGGSIYNKSIKVMAEYLRDIFYFIMFMLLLDPNTYNLKTTLPWDNQQHLKAKTSSICVTFLVFFFVCTKMFQSATLEILLAQEEPNANKILPQSCMKIIHYYCKQAAGITEETTANDGVSDSDPQGMKGYKYEVCRRGCGGGLITIDQIWGCYGNSADANALKDLCLSYALSRCLLRQRHFGLVIYPETSRLTECHDFVFKKLLPSDSEVDFKRAFRIIEVELGFCYDFFFTKYYYTFFWTNLLPVAIIPCSILLKIIPIVTIGVLAIRRSIVLETPNPIIEVHTSQVDYVITLAILGIALIVELVQAAFYLASNWAQVSLACMHVKKWCGEPIAYIYGKFIGLLRWVMISQQLRNKIGQRSIIFKLKHQPNSVKVSDAVKKAIARSLRSTYARNLTANEKISVRLHNDFSWALKGPSRLEIMFIWHIATEYCHISDDSSNWIASVPDGPRGVAVHLSRYCAYLIRSVPEVLPYHEANIAELKKEVDDCIKVFGYSPIRRSEICRKMKNLEGTGEEDDPRKMFQKGVKLGKELEMKKPDGECWEVFQDFWAEMIIHFAATPYTSKQHMQHLEDGGEFLTHIWALLAHAGILSSEGQVREKKDQGSQTDLESGPSVAE